MASPSKLSHNSPVPIVHTIPANARVPEEWPAHYTTDDRAAVMKVVGWLHAGATHLPGYQTQRTQSKLARAVGIDSSTLHLVMQGKYPSPPTKHLKRVLEVIERDDRRQRQVSSLPYVETTVHRLVFSVCHRSHLNRDIGMIAGRPGTGKTEALRRYDAEVESAILIEASYNMSASLLLDELVSRARATVRTAKSGSRGTQAQRLRAVIDALRGTDTLLIIDEADTLTAGNLEHLRRISDLAEIGVVLAGEPRLAQMLRDPDGRFGRIQSRVGFWPPVITAITEADCHGIVLAAHGDELPPDVLAAYWEITEGSARALSKLIPNVRDFGLSQGHELTPKLLYQIAQQTMGIKAAVTRGRTA